MHNLTQHSPVIAQQGSVNHTLLTGWRSFSKYQSCSRCTEHPLTCSIKSPTGRMLCTGELGCECQQPHDVSARRRFVPYLCHAGWSFGCGERARVGLFGTGEACCFYNAHNRMMIVQGYGCLALANLAFENADNQMMIAGHRHLYGSWRWQGR
jgi:hypothetical protein